jgi:hypothetical protein
MDKLVHPRNLAERQEAYEHPPSGRPLGRPLDDTERRLLAIDDDATRASAALDANKLSIAEGATHFLSEKQKNDPKWIAIQQRLAVAQRAQSQVTSDLAADALRSDYIALVDSSYIPEVQQLSISAPTTVEDIWKRENEIEVLATFLDGGRVTENGEQILPDTPSVAAARKKFRAALSAKQAKVYPVLRQAYLRLIADKVWADNVIVRGHARTISYTSAMFASNANIQTAFDGLAFDLRKLRFTRAQYQWCDGCRGYSYTLNVPSDATVVIWPGVGAESPFEPVK